MYKLFCAEAAHYRALTDYSLQVSLVCGDAQSRQSLSLSDNHPGKSYEINEKRLEPLSTPASVRQLFIL